ncbi:OmpA family protein [Pseudohongiella sp. SYSU M77423]|uniref:OmpA family protein n=1 Tax=unclassified Pseudohongiella TaxID=2629611 RepID=UPI001F3F9D9D|nr:MULTISPECIES: OmpA family protein [unclassified Pseudohongiella]MDH7942588.1 OmpA family protein [Pseudohongiella sp. SYSU M77423]MEC8860324.1 OmpA family protein [Pseudomonadota bacterium]
MSTTGKLIGTAVMTAALAACTTINPYTGEQQTSRAATYGAIGGVVCGLIGAAESGTRARNAALGCGAIGAGVGAYMDAQEAELRQELQGSGVQVQRNGDQLELIMPGNITFNTNEYSIRPNFHSVLDSVSQVLAKYVDTRLRVTGHTDSTGSRDYNYNLSDRRANSVANYLAANGIDQGRLITQGVGPDQPIASNDTESGRAMNRRVELQIVAIQN